MNFFYIFSQSIRSSQNQGVLRFSYSSRGAAEKLISDLNHRNRNQTYKLLTIKREL